MTASVSSARSINTGGIISSHPDSDFIPSILYTPRTSSASAHHYSGSTGEDSRGRTIERTYEVIEEATKAGLVKRRGSRSSLSPDTISAHHSLPSPVQDIISPNPILYLPPLLSPLPNGVSHNHDHDHDHHHEHVDRNGNGLSAAEILVNFETRLPDIDPASLALHQALHHFQPINEEYAATRYDQAFNWAALTLPKAVEREWYCVVFRSRRKPESSSLNLYAADREAHEEAVKNGGLVMYWYGVPDSTGLNLATCIWQSRRHAINAISGPKHRAAMKQTEGAYEVYELERWVLTTDAGKRGLRLHKWTGGDVGW